MSKKNKAYLLIIKILLHLTFLTHTHTQNGKLNRQIEKK